MVGQVATTRGGGAGYSDFFALYTMAITLLNVLERVCDQEWT
jgi:hypothetical protein